MSRGYNCTATESNSNAFWFVEYICSRSLCVLTVFGVQLYVQQSICGQEMEVDDQPAFASLLMNDLK